MSRNLLNLILMFSLLESIKKSLICFLIERKLLGYQKPFDE